MPLVRWKRSQETVLEFRERLELLDMLSGIFRLQTRGFDALLIRFFHLSDLITGRSARG